MKTVLRNPVYFIFLAMLGLAAYVTYNLNLWGPMLNMANAASSQALEEGKKRLREFLEENPRAAHAVAVSTGHDEYEMQTLKTSSRHKVKMDGAEDDDDDGI